MLCFLGDPDDLLATDDDKHEGLLKDWKNMPNLKLLNLVYDLTPCEFIAMVITEVGMVRLLNVLKLIVFQVPPTSIPAIIREYKMAV